MKKNILITGVAGFIGFHTAKLFLDKGYSVHGIDNLNDYYDPKLKLTRLDTLAKNENFKFSKIDVGNLDQMNEFWERVGGFEHVIHLAAQAGVRYSLENPYVYINSNVMGQTILLELCRKQPNFSHFVYASSSSVYGGNTDYPFSTNDRTDDPLSIYAATKRSCELIAQSYRNIYRIPSTGLRFFTVYGPWGRPDMSLFIFAKAIMEGAKVPIFNNGKMRRDFTYIDDIVNGIYRAHVRPIDLSDDASIHKVYNLGNNKSEDLMRYLELLQRALGKKALIDFHGMQTGDVVETCADISESQKDLGYAPQINIEEGIPRFVEWFLEYHKLNT